MAAENLFVEGIDPTPLAALGASELLQLIRNALPESYIGFIYVGESEPDYALNTHYLRFLWLTPSTGALKYYNGAAWVTVINVTSLSGTALTATTVTLAKLNPESGNGLKLVRVNTAGTAFEYITKAALYSNGELAVIKLAAGASRQFLMTVGGVTAWTTLLSSDVLTALGSNIMPIATLLATASGYAVPRQNSTGTAVEWATPSTLFPNNSLPVANLDSTGAAKDYVLKIDAAGAKVWGPAPSPTLTLPTPISTIVTYYDNGSWSCPTGISKFKIRAWGGGAYGDGAVKGGGAGAYVEEHFTAIAGDYTIVVGAGGTVGSADGEDTTVTDPTATLILTANAGASSGAGGAAAANAEYRHSIAGGPGNALLGGASPNGGFGGWTDAINGSSAGGEPGGGGGYNTNGAKGRVVIEY